MPDFTGLFRAFDSKRAKHSNLEAGVSSKGAFSKNGGFRIDGEDARTNGVVRGLQIFFLLISLFITIAIAVFQKANHVGVSALTALLLLVIVPSLLITIVLCAVPLINERTGRLRGINQAVSQLRFGFIICAAVCGGLLIFAFVQTISANTNGCKDPSKDPHADNKDYIGKLGQLCTNKRALAAFLWFSLLSWLVSAYFVFRQWRESRSSGRIPPFREPTDASDAFNAAEESFNPPNMNQAYSRTSASLNAGERQPFEDPLPTGYRQQQDPFTDPSPAYADPYDRIRHELDYNPRAAPQLPEVQYSSERF